MMRLDSFLLLAFIGLHSLNAQEKITNTHPLANRILPNPGTEGRISRNINHPDGLEFQNLKKSVGFLTWKEPGSSYYTDGSCVVVNTLNNTYNSNGTQRLLLLTAYHNDVPVGKHLENVSVSEFDKKQVFLSFDYEIANSEILRGRDVNYQEYADIRKMWRIKLIPLVQDSQSDIALYEIVSDENDPWTIDNSEIFQHVYASGWSLHLNDISKSREGSDFLSQISHPDGDWKKFKTSSLSKDNFIGPGTRSLNEPIDFNDLINTVNKKFLVIPRDNLFAPYSGSSGSPVFNSDKRISAIHSGNMTRIVPSTGRIIFDFAMETLLENSWFYTQNENGQQESNLQSIIDPSNTYLSYAKGGYINDLVANEEVDETFFDLEINQEGISKNVYLNAFEFYRDFPDVFDNSNESVLGHGVLPTDFSDNNIILTVKDSDDRIIYKAKYDNNLSGFQTRFKGKDVSFDSSNPFSPFEIPSTNIKSNILDIIKEESIEDSEIKSINNYLLNDVSISLKTESGSARVRAIKLPYMMPYNARELFEKTDTYDPYADLWRSNKYPESRGTDSDPLHVDGIKVELKAYVYNEASDPPECDELDWLTLKDISTGDNGGYLNLVNPNYQIDNVIVSDSRCGVNQLRITLYTDSTSSKHFGTWVDYDKQATDFSYTFNNATSALTQEANPSTNRELVVLHEIPLQENLIFENNTLKARCRVGVANTTLSSDGSGTYPQGEIEDYLLKIKKNDGLTRTDWLKVLGTSIVMTSAAVVAGKCLPDGTNVNEGSEEEEPLHQGIDETFPVHNLPLFGFGDGVCFDMLDMVNSYIGANALIFNGQMFMDIARGSELVHNAATEKTVAIDFLVEDINTTIDEVLFEEGGGANGLSIRRKNNQVEFGVKINDQLVTVESSTSLTVNQMTNVTAVFDEGHMTLYINGELVASSIVFAGQNITTIPEHSDDAALGGTTGAGIWNTVVGNFNGVVDYFAYWPKALTPVMIGVLARPINQNNNGRLADESEGEQQDSEITFSIFPNPTSDHLNILVEIRKAGPLNIVIFDLQGKKVYHMSKAIISDGHKLIKLRSLNNLDLASGAYVLKIQAGDVIRSEQIIFD